MVNISTSSAKLFRRCVCFLMALIFAFCCVIHPLRAEASITAATGAVVGITAAAAVGAAMIGLGLMPDGDGSAFTSTVNSIASSLDTAWTTTSIAGDVLLKAVLYKDNIYLQKELVQEVLDHIVVSDALQRNFTYDYLGSTVTTSNENDAYNYFLGYLSNFLSSRTYDCKYIYRVYTDSSIIGFYATNYPLSYRKTWNSDGYQYELVSSAVDSEPMFHLRFLYSPSTSTYTGSYTAALSSSPGYIIRTSSVPFYFTSLPLPANLSSSDGYVLGNLAPDINSPTYTDWNKKAEIIEFPTTYDPNNPEIPEESPDRNLKRWLGLGMTAATLAGLLTSSQAQVQSGVNEAVDPDSLHQTGEQVQIQVNSDAATDPDTNPDTNPDTGTTTNPDAAPEVTPGNFQVDLTQFFPFCIPFDLYKMLACLAADPVAPKFTFAIPTGLYGQIYEFEVDLSAWDEVAATLRIFETAIFCVGLYFATSKLIKW